MKKISYKITALIIASVLIIAVLVGAVSILRSSASMNTLVNSDLLNQSEKVARQLDVKFLVQQAMVDSLSYSLSNMIDINQLKSDPNYALELNNRIKPMIKQYAESAIQI